MRELFEIPFSPWSEKARWALDLCGVTYVSRPYVPVVGEVRLRRILKRWRGPVTWPLLRDGSTIVAESYEIARYADAHSRGVRLFPEGEEPRIRAFDQLSERGLNAGRALTLRTLLNMPTSLVDLAPSPLRAAPKVASRIAAVVVARTLRKYDGDIGDDAVHEGTLIDVLDALRAAVKASPSRDAPRTLLKSLSYADLAMAQVVASLRFPSTGLRLGAAGRAAFEKPRLAELYPDLIGWRDALYAQYRRPKVVPS